MLPFLSGCDVGGERQPAGGQKSSHSYLDVMWATNGSPREGRGRHGRLCPIVFAIFIPNTYNDMVNDKIVPISENQSIS